jgi:hypothetical protein
MEDEQQSLFINNDNIENSILIGNPGCGKTKTILDFVFLNSSKSTEFLILTFSKKAQIDLINKGKQISPIFNIYNIKTIHSLASTILNKLFNKTCSNITTIILATYKMIADKDISIVSCLKKCKFIIIDEAQDINENQYNLVKLIANKLKIPLILVGDPNQNIYQFQGGSDKFLLNHSNNKYILVNNYRSTNQIINFCNYLRPHNDLPLMVCKNNIDKCKPLIYINSLDNIIEHIINEINKNDCKLHEIAIIGPVKLSKNNRNIGLQLICNILHQNKINYIKYFKDDDNVNYDNNEKIETKEDHINILTCHSSKGLEFKKVLVINYHLTTFGRMPTKSDYNNFKYMWYVAFTRAMEDLIIYTDNTKYIFPAIKDVPKNCYNLESKYPLEIKEDFANEEELSYFPIVDTINNNKYFNEDNFYKFETLYKYDITEETLFDIDDKTDIFEFNQYSKLYGCFFEELFTFYCYKNNKSIQDYIEYKINKLENTVSISRKEEYDKYNYSITTLKKRGIICTNNFLNINNINRDKLTQKENEFIRFCRDNICNPTNIIKIIISLYTCEYNKSKLIKLYNSLADNIEPEKTLFDIAIYFYQLENECLRILDYDFNNNYNSIKHYFDKINLLTIDKPNYEFQIYNSNDYINLYGIIDILDDNKIIIELKFANNINIKYILQVLLYNNNYFYKKEMQIYNLKTGIKYTINFNNNLWNFNCFLCDILKTKMNNNIFILDIETNTIDTDEDFTNPQNTEIIDRYIHEYNFNASISNGLIKNKHKLTTSHINHIYEKDLLNADENLNNFKDDIITLFKYCENPIFIAHNGKRFDFPILEYHDILNKTNYKFKIIDTLYLFRLHINEYNGSNRLIELHNTICKKNIIQMHRAKEDVMLLVDIFTTLNYKTNDFLFI